MASSTALLLVTSPLHSQLAYRSTKHDFGLRNVLRITTTQKQRSLAVQCSIAVVDVAEPAVARRSAKYKQCVWDNDYIQFSMPNEFIDEKFKVQIEEMKQQVLVILGGASDQAGQLELINDLQRLGVAYHFQKEIKTILNRIYYRNYVFDENRTDADLYTTALACRLFRQHGYAVPQDVFKQFLDDNGKFKSSLCADVKGMISLYEASYLGTEGEAIMEEAWTFTIANLNTVYNKADDGYLQVLLTRSLDMPLHWRNARSEARWYIEEAYEKKPNMSPLVLQFAKLDYNVVQAIYREELRDLARWWKTLGFEDDLSFARDSLVISYLWGVIGSPEPQYEACRKAFSKIGSLISIVDDIYDLYGTLEEVELYTDAVKRWDVHSIKKLPLYMKKCYLACYNFVNDISSTVLKEKGSDVRPFLIKSWEIQASVYLKEARWFHSGYKPTLDEYMSDGWISVAITTCFLHCHIFDATQQVEEQAQYLESFPEILKWACTLIRLCDDLGTSPSEMERGDVPKAIQCYMNDTGVSEEAAREHVEDLVRQGWKKLNKLAMEEKTLTPEGITRLLNLVRVSHCLYQHGDGHGVQDGVTKHLMSKVLFDHIPL